MYLPSTFVLDSAFINVLNSLESDLKYEITESRNLLYGRNN